LTIWAILIAEEEFLMIWKKIKGNMMMKRKSSGLQDAVFLSVQKIFGSRKVLMKDFLPIRKKLIFAGGLSIQEKDFLHRKV
jgi:hypothetical protein